MLKARISKTNNKKLLKKLDISIKRLFTLKDFDEVLNLLAEEVSKRDRKKNLEDKVKINIEILDSDTKVIRWFIENLIIDSNLRYLPSDQLDLMNLDNSLLRRIVEKDLIQEPSVSKESRLQFIKEFDDLYEKEEKNEKVTLFSKFFNRDNKSENNNDLEIQTSQNESDVQIEEVEDSVFEETINHSLKTQEEFQKDIAKEIAEEEPTFDNYNDVINEVEETKNNDFTTQSENYIVSELPITSEFDQLPMKIQPYIKKSIDRKLSDDDLTQLKYDCLFNRSLEREQLKETQQEEMISKLQNKYHELRKSNIVDIKHYRESLEYTDDELSELEETKSKELEALLNQFVEKEKEIIQSKLKQYREEIELQYNQKELDLNSKLDERIQMKVLENTQAVEDYLLTCLEEKDIDIKEIVDEYELQLHEELKDELQHLLEALQRQFKEELNTFDKNSFKLIDSKEREFRRNILTKELRYNEKLKLENEKMKLEKALIDSNEAERELEHSKALARAEEMEFKKEQERAKILELEVEKEKQIYESKLLKETERNNDLKQQEIELQITNQELEKQQLEKKIEQPKEKKRTGFLVTILSLVIISLGAEGFIGYEHYKSTHHKEETPKYDTLIKNSQYEKALKLYPNKVNSLLEKSYKDKDIKGLQAVIDFDDDVNAKMYKDIVTNNHKEALSDYEKYKNKLTLNNEDLEIIGDMMIQESKIDDAITLNKKISSKSLEKKIEDATLLKNVKETNKSK